MHKLLKRNKIAGDDLRVQRKAKSTSPGSDRRMHASIIGRLGVKTLCMVNVSVDASTSTDSIVETMQRVLTCWKWLAAYTFFAVHGGEVMWYTCVVVGSDTSIRPTKAAPVGADHCPRHFQRVNRGADV